MNTISLSDELFESLHQFKESVGKLETTLGRYINAVDIVGEVEMSRLFSLRLTQSSNNEGFDAYDAEGKRVQIKASRGKTDNYRMSKLTGKNGELLFDYLLFVRYESAYSFRIASIYKADKKDLQFYLDHINSDEQCRKRKNGKKYRDIALSQFIRSAKWICNEQYKFVENPKYNPYLIAK